jgi:hypothetical protein
VSGVRAAAIATTGQEDSIPITGRRRWRNAYLEVHASLQALHQARGCLEAFDVAIDVDLQSLDASGRFKVRQERCVRRGPYRHPVQNRR